MLITYQKNNGNIIYRERKTPLQYKIGDITSMGWKVLNIEYKYNDKFYSKYEYNLLIKKNTQIEIRRKQTKEIFLKGFKTFLYYFISVLLTKIIKIIATI